MKQKICAKIMLTMAVLLIFSACSIQDEKGTDQAPDKDNPAEIENPEDKTGDIIERIDRYERTEITDWLDDQTVVLAKENRDLEKMNLLENAEFYPRSLYLYHLDTKEYDLIKAQKNLFLGRAILSPDKKHLLYHEYSIGDTAFYLMNMDESADSTVKANSLGIAYTAEWADAQNVIGVSYAGGAYLADMKRNITQLKELQEKQLFTVQKIKDRIYYVTSETDDSPSAQLYMLNLATKENKNLGLENTDGIIPSPDGSRILITQRTGSTAEKLLITDAEGNILKTIAEGTEVTGAAWSPNQSMISYQLKSTNNGEASSCLYLYDESTGESVQIVADIENAQISWSPSGKKIAAAEWHENYYNSCILFLK